MFIDRAGHKHNSGFTDYRFLQFYYMFMYISKMSLDMILELNKWRYLTIMYNQIQHINISTSYQEKSKNKPVPNYDYNWINQY